MKSYRLGLYEKSMPNTLTMEEKLQVAKRCGFDHLELSIDESDEKLARLDWGDEEIAAVQEAVRRVGVPILSICLSGHRKYPLGHPDPTVQERSLEIMYKAIALSVKLGVRLIQLAGYDVYYEESTPETREIFARNLKKSVDLAAREGVMLGFETMEQDFLNTVSKAMDWVERMDSPYLQVYPDAGNITNAALDTGGDIKEDLKRGRGHIAAIHLKESRPGVFREVPYGTGHVDFPAVAQTAKELGVSLFLAEFWYAGQPEWEGDIAHNSAWLREILDRVWA